MRLEVPAESRQFGQSLGAALDRAGGVELARQARSDGSVKTAVIAPMLHRAGIADIDPYSGEIADLAAAAAACRAAGAVALPYPLPGVLAKTADTPGTVVISPQQPVADHGELMTDWLAVAVDGRQARVTGTNPARVMITAPFARSLRTSPWSSVGSEPMLLYLLLEVWAVLGSLESALALAVQYSKDRSQFGSVIGHYQAIQFQIADAFVELAGLEVMAEHALGSYLGGSAHSATDVLAARVIMQEAAEKCLRAAHQVHGAIGFTDEHDLPWLSRFGHVARRSPLGPSGTLSLVTADVENNGFDGLFPVPKVARD